MKTRIRNISFALFAIGSLLVLGNRPAEAFWGRRVAVAYALPSAPVTVGYAPVVVSRPVVVASPVVTAGYAPVTTAYYAPAPVTTTYYAPAPVTTAYYAPAPITTSYYAPAPVTTYYVPPAGVIVRRPVIVWP